MMNKPINNTLAALALAGAALGLGGCLGGGGGGGFDCEAQTEAFDETSAEQGLLQAEVPAEGPFPMAMVLSTSAVNKLLATVLDQDLPAVREEVDIFSVTFQPQLPTIEIASVAQCPGCVITSLAFDIQVDTGVLGEISGGGNARLALPVGLAPISNVKTGLVASMDEASFLDLELTIGDLSTQDVQLVEDVIKNIATDYVRERFGAVEVVRFDSWKLGDDEMLLAARGPMIFPEQGTIVVGLHSNLLLPASTTIEEQAALPEGSELGLQIHPELLLTAMQRMLNTGAIPREYDASGNTDRRGDHQVTLDAMSSSDSDKLNTSFTIWRTGGGLCGFAQVSSDMSLSLDAEGVTLEADNFQITDGEGIGMLLSDAANSWLGGDFLQSLTENMALAINYREFGVEEEGEVQPKANGLKIDGRGLSVFLNLD